MARIQELSTEKQQQIIVAMVKALSAEAERLGVELVPAVLFVMGTEPPLMCSTMEPRMTRVALKVIQQMEIDSTVEIS